MAKEVKIGLAVIGLLLAGFAVVCAVRLRQGQTPAAADRNPAAEQKKAQDRKAGKRRAGGAAPPRKLESGPGKITKIPVPQTGVQAAESAPRDGSMAAAAPHHDYMPDPTALARRGYDRYPSRRQQDQVSGGVENTGMDAPNVFGSGLDIPFTQDSEWQDEGSTNQVDGQTDLDPAGDGRAEPSAEEAATTGEEAPFIFDDDYDDGLLDEEQGELDDGTLNDGDLDHGELAEGELGQTPPVEHDGSRGRYGSAASQAPDRPAEAASRREKLPDRAAGTSATIGARANRDRAAGADSTDDAGQHATRVYEVRPGDTLFDIARHELGRAARWSEIYDLNAEQLGQDVDYLPAGMELKLPRDRSPGSRSPDDGAQRGPLARQTRPDYRR